MEILVFTCVADIGIAQGSGIVAGRRNNDVAAGKLQVWFEGNLNGAVNLHRWADRVHCAADRMVQGYPTSATGVYEADNFRVLGFYDIETGLFDWQVPHWRSTLEQWLGHEVSDVDLQSSVSSHAAMREMSRLRTSGSPREQALAQFLSSHGPRSYKGR